MIFSKHFFKNICNTVSFAYLVILFAVYPFYMKNGYVGIDVAKYKFFLFTSLGAIVLLLLFGLSELINSVINRKFGIVNASISIFAVVSIISYALSNDKNTALVGANGWFMGLSTILIMCVLSFLISILYYPGEYLWYPVLGGSFIVFIIGICDRFSFYLIPLSVRDSSFISTIGNINWFMGYYSVIAPLGIFLLMKEFTECKYIDVHTLSKAYKCKIWFLIVYTIVTFMSGFVQGSESILLFYIALFIGSFILWSMKVISFESLCSMLFLWGISGQIVKLLRTLFPGGYNYETTGVLSAVQTGMGTLVAAVLSVIAIYIYKKSQSENKDKVIRILTIILISLLIVLYVVLGVLNTLGLLGESLPYSLLLFDERFGSGRGHAYKAALNTLRNMSPKQLAFGVGPDCFSSLAYAIPTVRDELTSVWGDLPLLNTHCELLTMLINEGIIGLLSYLGIFVCSFVAFMKKCKKPETMCISLAIFCYLVHNLISFSQVVNTPYLFALIGVGSGYLLSKEEK